MKHLILTILLLQTVLSPVVLAQESESTATQPVATTPVAAPAGLQAPTQSTIFLQQPQASATEAVVPYYNNQTIDFDAQTALKNIQILDAGMLEIAKQIIDLDADMKDNDTYYQQTRTEILAVVEELRNARKELESSVTTIQAYQQRLLLSAQKIDELRLSIDKVKGYITRFSQFLYDSARNISNDDGTIDEIRLFVKSNTSVSTTLSNEAMMEQMIETLNTLIQNMEAEQAKQAADMRQSNRLKQQARSQILNYNNTISRLHQKRQYLTDFLEIYASNTDKIKGSIKNLFETRQEVEKKITDRIQELTTQNFTASYDITSALKELRDLQPYFTGVKQSISRPILGVDKITTYFNDTDYLQQYGIPFNGIQLEVPQYTPIYAVDEALVYAMSDPDSMSLNRMILLHQDGHISVYKFFTKTLVKEGDVVRRGQLIAYSGGEPGTKGAGFISQAPNLTFELYIKGKPIDPLTLLDLSTIANRQSLPDTYEVKYLKDLYGRPRDMYSVQVMTGKTLDERREQFLNLYAVGIFREPLFREDAAEGTNIDTDVGICIGFAESTLGKYLTTDNNIGNVGNNDRGDRVPFGSAVGGARAIYNTLNNGYLGKYNTILELSRYGNQTAGAIYASSPYNWQNNVSKCLSMIKGYVVPDEFPFRVGLNPRATTE